MNPEIQEKKFDVWRHGLLDVGKRNKMMNYRKTKRATLQITSPDLSTFYQRLAVNEEAVSFRKRMDVGGDIKLSQLLYLMDKLGTPVELANGEISSDLSLDDMNKTLKNLRSKSRLSLEEQGINILYLSFGFLEWRQKASDNLMLSPLVLVPVSIEVDSISSPYKIKKIEEDVVVNPTLEYVLAHDFGIHLPEFDAANGSITEYLNLIKKIVQKAGWNVVCEVSLGLLSFLKIVMYKDLEKYKDRIFANPVVQAFCGDSSRLPQLEDKWREYNHDTIPCKDTYQVVNADASQQDAILLSKRGVSFVLQGPPGTGKSQTITNIIAEGLADNKKILFVSEKMAALSVVYHRLQEVGLSDYCLTLHNYKAEKKGVIQDLVNTLDAPKKELRSGVADFLEILEEERLALNTYFQELYIKREPLNWTIYQAVTDLTMLENVPLYKIKEKVSNVTEREFKKQLATLKKYKDFIEHYEGDIEKNPWNGTNISLMTYDVQNGIEVVLNELNPILFGISSLLSCFNEDNNIHKEWNWKEFLVLISNLGSYSIYREIMNQIFQYYQTELAEGLNVEGVNSICKEGNKFLGTCLEQGLKISDIDGDNAREQLLKGLKSDVLMAADAKKWIADFNTAFKTGFQPNREGYSKLLSFVRAAFSFELYEKVWYENDGYNCAVRKAEQTEKQVENICARRKEVCEFVSKNLLYSTQIYSLIPLERYYDFAKHSIDLVSGLKKELDVCLARAAEQKIGRDNLCTAWFRNDTLQGYCETRDELTKILEFVRNSRTIFNQNFILNSEGIAQINAFLDILLIPYQISTSWFENNQYNRVKALLESEKKIAVRIRKLKAILDAEWTSDLYSVNGSELLGKFRMDYTSFFKRLGGAYRQDKKILVASKKNLSEKLDDKLCISALEMLQEYQDLINQYSKAEVEAKEVFGSYYLGIDTNWDNVEHVINTCDICNTYIQQYGMSQEMLKICNSPYSSRRSMMIRGQSVDKLISENVASSYYDMAKKYDGFLDVVYIENEEKVKALESVIMICNKIEEFIRNDYAICTSQKEPVVFKESVEIEQLENYMMVYTTMMYQIILYDEVEDEVKKLFPHLYYGIQTDWGKHRRDLTNAKEISELFETQMLPEKMQEWLEQPISVRAKSSINQINLQKLSIGKADTDFRAFYEKYKEDIGETVESLNKKIFVVEQIQNCANKLQKMFLENRASDSIQENIAFFCKYIDIVELLGKIGNRYKEYFSTIQLTTVDEESFTNMQELFEEYLSTDRIREKSNLAYTIFESSDVDVLEKELGIILAPVYNLNEKISVFEQFESLFSPGMFSNIGLENLMSRVEKCKNMECLKNWLTYADLVQLCNDNGLTEYLQYLRENHPKVSWISSIYKKSFLSRWLLDLLVDENISYLMKFQTYAHEKAIMEFKSNDAKQLKLAQARLEEKLSHEKPSGITKMANAMDEVSILRREAEKRRKIMPLRKLFKVIPSLLQKLKPCFMMSPLSVSYFLDSDMYEFDMVIFDEASQILPEDAIGAIYRGKQVIIAGDTKQMPPTNFFNATAKNEEEYDSDEDEDYLSDIVSESILDEANTYLPSCTLLWHYRSKDESLIAFSNREIYGNKLITFPNCNRSMDRGLEYVYVQNGCYEDRSNVLEARKCVQLVAAHIENHPDSSLGIIAFSEKQQGVIEDAVNDFRLKNSQYEEFFDEGKDEPFFIKNLENVQGDERDTIIFSICYAKNSQGKMYMRFGPLGLAGGERRLNVAITRAKYSIKLVGSIMPTDIDLNKVKTEGVRLLREYIYYAMQNDYGMPLGTDTFVTDEYFTDIIADFILENGYRVKRNVGASQYKVDMAIIHPDSSDEYFAGIECDGNNYIMARTARDRDVLRKDIMSTMGWELYHVWSFSWYNNPQEEKKRLLEFLREASEHFFDMKSHREEHRPLPEVDFLEDSMDAKSLIMEKDTTSEVHELKFAKYRVCNPWDATYTTGADNYANLSSRIMHVMEHEAPIHHELLYKRLATIFGNQKVTAPIRRTIDDCIRKRLTTEIIEIDSFMYLSKSGEIVARVPESESDGRPIEYICQEEIQDAIIQIINFALGLTIEDLIGEIARTFGFARTGSKIRQAIISNYDRLYEEGKLKKSDEKIYLKEGM